MSLVSVADSLDTKSAAGRLVLNIMVSVSEWEREAIGERTRDALRLKQSKGERIGNVAFGYRLAADDVHLEAEPTEHQILARMRSVRAAGITLRGIAAQLNREGFTTRRGTAWRHQYVAAVLRAETDSDQLASPPAMRPARRCPESGSTASSDRRPVVG